jgi:hypothetical protein
MRPEGTKQRSSKGEHENSRAIEISADATSGGRSSKSTPLVSSFTLTKVKEVWERLADGMGMGRRRWVLVESTEVGLVESEEVLPESR